MDYLGLVPKKPNDINMLRFERDFFMTKLMELGFFALGIYLALKERGEGSDKGNLIYLNNYLMRRKRN